MEKFSHYALQDGSNEASVSKQPDPFIRFYKLLLVRDTDKHRMTVKGVFIAVELN